MAIPLRWTALLVAAIAALGAAGPGDLIVGESYTPPCPPGSDVLDCVSSSQLSSIDPETGAFSLEVSSQDRLLDVAAGRSGAIAAAFESNTGTTSVFYRDAAGAGLPPGGFFTDTHGLAVENHGDLLLHVPGGIARYRVRYPLSPFQPFSSGAVDDIAVGPAGELYVRDFTFGQAPSIQAVDPATGARTPVSAELLDPLVVEAGGDILGFDLAGNLMRLDPATGDASLVVALGYRGGLAVGPDGTIFVATRESTAGAGDGFIVTVDPVTGAPATLAVERGLGGVVGFAAVNCPEENGACVVEPQCSRPETCDDDLFCTGSDLCNATGLCEQGGDPCTLGGVCDEQFDRCYCTGGIPCGDGLFCNGEETCSDPSGGSCEAGAPPCASGESCDEESDRCVAPASGDLDIRRLDAPRRATTGKPARLTVKLKNPAAAPAVATLRMTGVQNGLTLLDETRSLTALPRERLTESYSVPITDTGAVTWTATVLDGDPDTDFATEATGVDR